MSACVYHPSQILHLRSLRRDNVANTVVRGRRCAEAVITINDYSGRDKFCFAGDGSLKLQNVKVSRDVHSSPWHPQLCGQARSGPRPSSWSITRPLQHGDQPLHHTLGLVTKQIIQLNAQRRTGSALTWLARCGVGPGSACRRVLPIYDYPFWQPKRGSPSTLLRYLFRPDLSKIMTVQRDAVVCRFSRVFVKPTWRAWRSILRGGGPCSMTLRSFSNSAG